MFPFPTQNWEKTLGSIKAKPINSRNSGYASGRLASRIVARLYLSDLWTASDADRLNELGITHVISVIETKPDLPEFILQDRRLHLPLADVADSDILQHLDTTTSFITKALEDNEDNKVLVHCMAGVSRSATVVCGYLIATTDMTTEASIEYVKSMRGIICPNIGFTQQLVQYSTRHVKVRPRPARISLLE